jgi:hypothetical protein
MKQYIKVTLGDPNPKEVKLPCETPEEEDAARVALRNSGLDYTEVWQAQSPNELARRTGKILWAMPPGFLRARATLTCKNYIIIRVGDGAKDNSEVHAIDTEEQRVLAAKALRKAGLDSAPVWEGGLDGDSRAVRTSRCLYAPNELSCFVRIGNTSYPVNTLHQIPVAQEAMRNAWVNETAVLTVNLGDPSGWNHSNWNLFVDRMYMCLPLPWHEGYVEPAEKNLTCTVCIQELLMHSGCSNIECPIGYHNVLSRNTSEDSRRTIKESTHTGEDPLEDIKTSSYNMGYVMAKEALSERFLKLAGEQFVEGNTDRATLLRNMGRGLEKEALEVREKCPLPKGVHK